MMSRKQLKVTILAMVAALALSAAAATTASAGSFEAASYPATITGEQTTAVVFTGVVGKWQCKKVDMLGQLTAKSEVLTLAPTYGECSWAGLAATTNMEGCTYEFSGGETVGGSESKIAGTMSVRCPVGKQVKLVLNAGTCTIFIPEQTNLSSVTFEDLPSAPADVKLTFALTGIKYSIVEGAFGCPNKPGNGTYTNGTIAGDVTLRADNKEGAQIAFGVS